MIEIEKTKFLEKFTEINFRQRMYEGKNFITLIVSISSSFHIGLPLPF